MSLPILQAQNLCKAFSTSHGEVQAVKNISFKAAEGEFLCIVGPSGCGKTTLLQLLAGLEPPSRGEVWLAGRRLVEPPPEISIVFQKPNLMPWRTVLDNVILPLQVQGQTAASARQQGHDTLAMVGLGDFAKAYPAQLSGGMEQRVALARALVQRPQLLLLDEPFGALDALSRERLNYEILRLWREQSLTALMVTHNIREAVYLADRVLVLSPRPATIFAEFPIDLPRPRPEGIEYTEALGKLAYEIRQAIRE